MGQKVNPYGIEIGYYKDFNCEWHSESELYISDDLLHHSMKNRKIHLKKILGKKSYKKMIKSLSR